MSTNDSYKAALRDLSLILIIAVIFALVISNGKIEPIYFLISMG